MLLPFILAMGDIIFDSLYIVSGSGFASRHRFGQIFVEHLAFLRVRYGLLHCGSLCFLKGDFLAQIGVLIGQHLIWVEAQHIFIPDSVSDAVAVKLISENRCGNAAFFLVFILNGGPGKAEENRPWESLLNPGHHILAKNGAVALIHNEYNAL